MEINIREYEGMRDRGGPARIDLGALFTVSVSVIIFTRYNILEKIASTELVVAVIVLPSLQPFFLVLRKRLRKSINRGKF